MLLNSLRIIFLTAFLFSCSTKGNIKESGIASDLDTAIIKTGEAIIGKVPKRTKIALFNISTNESVLTEYVIEELSALLVEKGNFIIVERKNREVIEAEQIFQASGNVRDEDICSIGQNYGAASVVTCSITGQADLRRLRVRTLDVKTGEVQSLTTHPIGDIANDKKYNSQVSQIEKIFEKIKYSLNDKVHNIVIMEFTDSNNRQIQLGQYIANELKNYLSQNSSHRIMSSGYSNMRIKRVQEELSFQLSDEVDDVAIEQLGKTLGVDIIIGGKINKVSGNIYINIEAIEVETGVAKSYTIETNEEKYVDML